MPSRTTRLSPRAALGVLIVTVLALFAGSLGSADAGTTGTITADGTCYVIDFTYDDGATDDGTFCGFGNELDQQSVPSLTATTLHVSCSDQFPGGVPEKSDLGGRLVTSWSIEKYKDGDLDKTCGDADALADSLPDGIHPDGECFVYSFTYDDGAVDDGTHCGGKDLTRDDVPGLNAVSLHLSCSDTFPLGYAEKSDIGDLRVDLWSIQKYKDGELDKECSGDPDVSTDVLPDGDCFVYSFTYGDGAVDAGTHCGDKDLTRDDNRDLLATKLHLSCSDTFPLGYAEKSDIGDLRVDLWSIQKYKDGELDKECSGDPDLTDPETPDTPDGIPADGDCVVIDFRYTTGEVDQGTYCGTGNDIDRTEAPGLNAVELHVSCSDDFHEDGTAEKSDLGGLLISSWSIQKYKDGELSKSCGETYSPPPPPPAPEYCFKYDVHYTPAGSVGSATWDSGEICGTSLVTRDAVPALFATSIDVSCALRLDAVTLDDETARNYDVSWVKFRFFEDGARTDVCTFGTKPAA